MKILILGGTRYLGKRLVEMLLKDGHKVTVLSRHPEKALLGAEVIGLERQEGIKKLFGKTFDMVIDFIAFDGKSVSDTIEKLQHKMYVLISSAWICRLGKNIKANEKVTPKGITELNSLPPVTQKYLLGKLEAENIVLKSYRDYKDAVILRLPIQWGVNDPTGRVEFYLRRIQDGHPVIRVNGGDNIPSMAWMDDTAKAITNVIAERTFNKYNIWEGLTTDQLMTKDIISALAEGLDRELLAIDISARDLQKAVPRYLEAEPLWMLKEQCPTANNIFRYSGVQETQQSDWLKQVSGEAVLNRNLSDERLRAKEIKFLINR